MAISVTLPPDGAGGVVVGAAAGVGLGRAGGRVVVGGALGERVGAAPNDSPAGDSVGRARGGGSGCSSSLGHSS
ncbi:hypothetical protein, partial [Micromonospora harpali]